MSQALEKMYKKQGRLVQVRVAVHFSSTDTP